MCDELGTFTSWSGLPAYCTQDQQTELQEHYSPQYNLGIVHLPFVPNNGALPSWYVLHQKCSDPTNTPRFLPSQADKILHSLRHFDAQ